MTDQKQQLKEWVIQNMIDIEADNLDEEKRKMFLDLVSERKDDEFMQECYTEFEKRKEEEDVCCVGCGDRVCGFHEEPDHKDDRDEAVCNDCYECIEEEDVCDDCGEEDCSMDGLCCPEAIERTEKETIIYDCDGCGLNTPNDELWNLSGTSAESYEARTECLECMKLAEEPIICSACKRDFTDEVDGRSSFAEALGKILCMDCFNNEEGVFTCESCGTEDIDDVDGVDCPRCDFAVCDECMVCDENDGNCKTDRCKKCDEKEMSV
jgi:hypothetical protein